MHRREFTAALLGTAVTATLPRRVEAQTTTLQVTGVDHQYGAMRASVDEWVPDPSERRIILVDTPAKLFRF